MEQIREVTGQTAMNDDAKVGAQGIEFWTSLAEHEYERLSMGQTSDNIIAANKEFLFQLVLAGI